MRNLFKLFSVILFFSCNKNESPQEQVKNDCTGEYTTEEKHTYTKENWWQGIVQGD